MNTVEQPPQLSGDRPLTDFSEDRLGFGPMASAVAQSILAQAPTPGLVMGLEGPWGSGKSSLLNLVMVRLREIEQTQPLALVEFRPWLVGDRDQLLSALFIDLASKIDALDAARGNITGQSVGQAKAVGAKIRHYASRLAGPGKLLSAASLVVPGLNILGEAMQTLADAASAEAQSPSLAELKDDLAKDLTRLQVPIVVTIDDVDRLEPSEAIELLRLVRSVADLPNVIYVLCYDHDVLAKAVQAAAQVTDGAAFLEKIIQVVVQAPLPEPFDLRHWFATEVAGIVGGLEASTASRLQQVIDVEGGRRLTTPRAVVRTLNGLRFDWPSVAGQVDPSDFVWLQLVKASNTKLYRWVEDYCSAYAATERGRAHLSKGSVKRDNDVLNELLRQEGRTLQDEVYSLANYLPGIQQMHFGEQDEPTFIHRSQSEFERDIALRGKRLASPDHYRLFFALSAPAVAPRAEDFAALNEALATSHDSVEELLLAWAEDRSTAGVSRVEMIFDRLQTVRPLSDDAFLSLWSFFADRFDGPLAQTVPDTWGNPRLWTLAERIARQGFIPVALEQRGRAIVAAFETGAALGWLADLYRGQLFAHGRIPPRASPEKRVISAEELDLVTPIILERLERTGVLGLLQLPDGVSALLAWIQGGPKEGSASAQQAIASLTAKDAGFLAILDHLRTQVRTAGNDGQTVTNSYFRRDYVDLFMDFDGVIARLKGLAEGPPGTMQADARAKLDEIEGGGEW